MKNAVIIILLSLSLAGCVAVVGGAAIGSGTAALAYDQRPTKTIMDDENISYLIMRGLKADDALSEQAHLVVSTYRGNVLLAGQAPTQALKDQAESIAKQVSGIRRLYNEIVVEAPDSALVRSSDAWITAKIKSQLLVEKGLQSGQFKVVTEDGVVYLMGVASRSQANVATEVVRQVDGVQKVITMFEYQYSSPTEVEVHEEADDPEK